MIKDIYITPVINSMLVEKDYCFLLKIGKKAKESTTTIQHSTGCFSQHNKARKGNKSHPDKKGRNKHGPICMTIFVEKPKKSATKFPELINYFNEVAGYRIMQNQLYFYRLVLKK